jgi:calcineurin-like phosphoesterase family protein
MNYFFTADTHFGHDNIRKYCHRPFNTVEEMNNTIIQNWNSRVTKNDIVFHLGDFAFGNSNEEFDKYFNQLNGKIIFIKGNHDDLARKNKRKFQLYLTGYYEIKIEEQTIILCHYAMRVWNKSHFGSWHLYGHTHGTLSEKIDSLSFDVGIDTNNFYPYSFYDIKNKMNKKVFVPIDPKDRER